MSNKAILLNGPKLCGKDVAINHLIMSGNPVIIRECKNKLHELTQAFFCVQPERYWQIYHDRSLKEKPLSEFNVTLIPYEYPKLKNILGPKFSFEVVGFNGVDVICNLSIREAMIYVSEIICKTRFGSNYFGVARVKSIRENEIIIDGSTGFQEELPPLIDKLGQDNILLLRIHRDGFTYEGDSRSYIPDGVITNTIDVYNNGPEIDYLTEVERVVRSFLDDKQ